MASPICGSGIARQILSGTPVDRLPRFRAQLAELHGHAPRLAIHTLRAPIEVCRESPVALVGEARSGDTQVRNCVERRSGKAKGEEVRGRLRDEAQRVARLGCIRGWARVAADGLREAFKVGEPDVTGVRKAECRGNQCRCTSPSSRWPPSGPLGSSPRRTEYAIWVLVAGRFSCALSAVPECAGGMSLRESWLSM